MAWTRDVCEQSRKPPSVVPPQLPDRWRLGRGVACLATFLAACPGPTPPPPVALSITPTSATIRIGETQPFAAKVTGTTNIAVTWAVVEATGGTVSSNGLYTAPMTPGAYRVQATSMADPSKSSQATVTVTSTSGVEVSISPSAVSLEAGATQQFTATVIGTSNAAVTWAVVESGGGAVSSGGLYTAPAVAGTYHVKATSVADTAAASTATVTVTPGPSVAVMVYPSSVTLNTGDIVYFVAIVSGTSNTGVTWTVLESAGGSISVDGVYTAPQMVGTYHVQATSVANASRTASATVTVLPSPTEAFVSINPVVVSTNQTVQFTATVTGLSNTAVTWSIVEPGGGTVTDAGLYTPPPTAGTYHVRATSVADPSKYAQATVIVPPPPPVVVSVSPSAVSVQTGEAFQFTARVTGTANTSVTWTVVETGGGAVDANGVYTAPATTGTYHVKATSVADTSKSSQATVTVKPAVLVTIAPTTVSLTIGSTQQFTATVTGTANTAVSWTVMEAGGGTVSATGLYTAPQLPGTYHLKATSIADTARSAQATVTCTPCVVGQMCNGLVLDGEMSVGPTGGTLTTLSGVRVVVPEGALVEPMTLSVKILPDSPISGGLPTIGHVYRLEPDGYGFFVPIQLVLPNRTSPSVVADLDGNEGIEFLEDLEGTNTVESWRLSTYAAISVMTNLLSPGSGAGPGALLAAASQGAECADLTVQACIDKLKHRGDCTAKPIRALADQVKAVYASPPVPYAPITLVHVPSSLRNTEDLVSPYLDQTTATILGNTLASFLRPPKALQLVDALRTLPQQVVLKALENHNKTKDNPTAPGCSPPVAKSGASKHGDGHAFDISPCKKSCDPKLWVACKTDPHVAKYGSDACCYWINALSGAFEWGGDFKQDPPDCNHFYLTDFNSSAAYAAFLGLWNSKVLCDVPMQANPTTDLIVSRVGFAPATGFGDGPFEGPDAGIDIAGHFCCGTDTCFQGQQCISYGGVKRCGFGIDVYKIATGGPSPIYPETLKPGTITAPFIFRMLFTDKAPGQPPVQHVEQLFHSLGSWIYPDVPGVTSVNPFEPQQGDSPVICKDAFGWIPRIHRWRQEIVNDALLFPRTTISGQVQLTDSGDLTVVFNYIASNSSAKQTVEAIYSCNLESEAGSESYTVHTESSSGNTQDGVLLEPTSWKAHQYYWTLKGLFMEHVRTASLDEGIPPECVAP